MFEKGKSVILNPAQALLGRAYYVIVVCLGVSLHVYMNKIYEINK